MGFGGMGSITSGPGSSGSGPGGFGNSGSGSGLGGFGFSGSLATSMPSEQQLSGHSSSSTISRARDRAVTRTRNRRRSERHKERSGRCVGLVRDRVRNTAARDSFLADPRLLESRAREDPMRWRAPLRELLLGQNLSCPDHTPAEFGAIGKNGQPRVLLTTGQQAGGDFVVGIVDEHLNVLLAVCRRFAVDPALRHPQGEFVANFTSAGDFVLG
jgi:hypothetical protein